jgi:tripeptidyl-peptidase-1
MVALLNGWRINNSKKPLGFLNPMIYTASAISPPIFKDIVSGNNDCTEYCCGSLGFAAQTGWDAST